MFYVYVYVFMFYVLCCLQNILAVVQFILAHTVLLLQSIIIIFLLFNIFSPSLSMFCHFLNPYHLILSSFICSIQVLLGFLICLFLALLFKHSFYNSFLCHMTNCPNHFSCPSLIFKLLSKCLISYSIPSSFALFLLMYIIL